MRFIIVPIAGTDKFICTLCAAVIFVIEISVGIEYFGKGYINFGASLCFYFDMKKSGKVLTEIYYALALGGYYKFFGVNMGVFRYIFALLRYYAVL